MAEQTLEQTNLHDFLAEAQATALREGRVDEALLEAIKSQSNCSEAHKSFLQAEVAFHQGDYRLALKYYLSAKGVSKHNFYCFRASAFVSEELGRLKKAISYLRQALEICPDDLLCLGKLTELLTKVGENAEAEDIQAKLQEASDKAPEDLNAEPDDGCQVGLADEEIQELSNLFQDDSEESTSMNTEDTQNQDASVCFAESPATESCDVQADPNTLYFGDSDSGSKLEDASRGADQALDKLKQFANSGVSVESKATTEFLSDDLGLGVDSGPTLEQRVRSFQRAQVDTMSRYIENHAQRARIDDNFLLVLNGWDYNNKSDKANISLKECLLPAPYRRSTGGFFMRWHGKGLVINPGPNFLEKFHQQGLHIKDIDYVVVTQDSPCAYEDVQAIYDLNYALNKMDAQLHIINYYLNQQAHRHLSPRLKPHFKQERNTVHSLELFVDSPDTECLLLHDSITLHYFATSAQEAGKANSNKSTAVGIRLALKHEKLGMEDAKVSQIGYVSGTPYSPIVAHHLSACDAIIAGWEHTGPNDFAKLNYNENSLGYYGTASLMEETNAKVILCCEFSGREGDFRVEGVKKLRQEEAFTKQQKAAVVPGDTGMVMDLETQCIQCSVTKTFVDASQVRVVKTQDAFGQLKYLSRACFA